MAVIALRQMRSASISSGRGSWMLASINSSSTSGIAFTLRAPRYSRIGGTIGTRAENGNGGEMMVTFMIMFLMIGHTVSEVSTYAKYSQKDDMLGYQHLPA